MTLVHKLAIYKHYKSNQARLWRRHSDDPAYITPVKEMIVINTTRPSVAQAKTVYKQCNSHGCICIVIVRDDIFDIYGCFLVVLGNP